MVGDKDDERIGIRVLAVVLNGGELVFVGAAAKEILHAAHEENLKRRHQRRSAGAVENLGQIVFGEIELEEAEVTQIGRDQVLEDCVAKALAEKSFIADENVGRAQLARFQFADKAFGLGEGAHQNFVLATYIVFDCNILNSIRLVVNGNVVVPMICSCARGPSLRLKNGYAQDDITNFRTVDMNGYNLVRKSITSGEVQSTGPMNLRRITPWRSMM